MHNRRFLPLSHSFFWRQFIIFKSTFYIKTPVWSMKLEVVLLFLNLNSCVMLGLCLPSCGFTSFPKEEDYPEVLLRQLACKLFPPTFSKPISTSCHTFRFTLTMELKMCRPISFCFVQCFAGVSSLPRKSRSRPCNRLSPLVFSCNCISFPKITFCLRLLRPYQHGNLTNFPIRHSKNLIIQKINQNC